MDASSCHLAGSGPPLDGRGALRIRSASYEPAREAGARGGYTIPHAYRVSDAGDEIYQDWLGGAVAQGRGKWRTLIDFVGHDWEALRPLVGVAPHLHQMALAEEIDGDKTTEIEEETGWAVENVRSLAPLYIDESEVPPIALLDENYRIERTEAEAVREGYEDMVRMGMYLLSL